jgi:hypothetical protein
VHVFKRSIWLLSILCILFITTLSYPVCATEPYSSEYLLKAAFIYNIAKFVEWPPGSFETEKAPLVLCILGKDPFGYALTTIDGKMVQGRTLTVKHVDRIEELRTCHILFISSSERNKLPQEVQSLKDANVLTVGDMPNFAQNGGIINLITLDNKIHMEINVAAAEKAKLQISSKLLKLARVVNE